MRKNIKNLFLSFSIGWLVIFSACSNQPNTILDQQLANITAIEDMPTSTLIQKRLSPNAEWYISSTFDEYSRVSYQVISTKDPTVTFEQDDHLGYSYTGSDPWAPDSSAFVAIDFESPSPCGMNKILIITLSDNELTTTIYHLPIEDCLSVEWFSDSEHLLIHQASTFYIINKDGQLEWEYSYDIPDNFLYQLIDNHIILYQYTEEGTEVTVKTINLSNLEIGETIYMIGDVQFTHVTSFRYKTDLAIFFEEGNNRVWLFDSVDNTLTPTNITIPGDVLRVDIVGSENKVSAMFIEDDSFFLNIYDLSTEEIDKSISINNYIGWYPEMGGFLIWTGTDEDGRFKIVN